MDEKNDLNIDSIEFPDNEGFKKVLSDTKQDIDKYKTENVELAKPINAGEDVLDKILKKGVEAFKEWVDMQKEVKMKEADAQAEVEKARIDFLEKSDKRNSIVTTIISISALITLFVLSAIDKISPEVAVIIGVLINSLFSNRISKGLNEIVDSYKKRGNTKE